MNFAKFLSILFDRTPPDELFCPIASGFFSFTQLFFATQWTNRNQVFSVFEHVLSRLLNVINITNFTCKTDDRNFQAFRSTQVFSYEYCKIFKSNYFEEHLRKAASEARINQRWTRESRCSVSILKYLSKLTGKRLYQSLFFNKGTRYRSTT